jgi:DNA mismatch repair protein MutS2
MNRARKKLPQEKTEPRQTDAEFKGSDNVKYHSKKGTIVSMKDKKEAIVEIDGMRVRAKTSQLKHTQILQQKHKTDVSVNVKRRAGLKCDLHGMRADEAIEVLDKFVSDALINGWDEVIIYHGIGTGKLSYAVKEFLKTHPKVKKFEDAPQHMGGFGAKIVTL